MGRDRQEKKLLRSGKVENGSVQSDRDKALYLGGATRMEGPDAARERNTKR